MRKHIGYIEDRLVTPHTTYEHLPTQTMYVDFPLMFQNMFGYTFFGGTGSISVGQEPEYQRRRYYSDERPMKLKDFKKLCKEVK